MQQHWWLLLRKQSSQRDQGKALKLPTLGRFEFRVERGPKGCNRVGHIHRGDSLRWR